MIPDSNKTLEVVKTPSQSGIPVTYILRKIQLLRRFSRTGIPGTTFWRTSAFQTFSMARLTPQRQRKSGTINVAITDLHFSPSVLDFLLSRVKDSAVEKVIAVQSRFNKKDGPSNDFCTSFGSNVVYLLSWQQTPFEWGFERIFCHQPTLVHDESSHVEVRPSKSSSAR